MIISHNHSALTVSNLERSVAFYCEVIGFKVDVTLETESAAIKQITGFPDAHLKIAHLLLGDFRLELIQYLAPQGKAVDTSTCNVGTAHIAFFADDVDKTYRELQAKRVRFRGAPVSAAPGRPRVAYFLDPDGITLELSQAPR